MLEFAIRFVSGHASMQTEQLNALDRGGTATSDFGRWAVSREGDKGRFAERELDGERLSNLKV